MTKSRGGGGVDCVGELAYKLASLSRVTKAGSLRRGWGELANALFCTKSCSTILSRCSLDHRIFFAGTASLPVFLRSRQLESLSNQQYGISGGTKYFLTFSCSICVSRKQIFQQQQRKHVQHTAIFILY